MIMGAHNAATLAYAATWGSDTLELVCYRRES